MVIKEGEIMDLSFDYLINENLCFMI